MHALGIVWWLAQWPGLLLWVSMFADMADTVNDGCAVGKNEAPEWGLCYTVPQHLQLVPFDDVNCLALAQLVSFPRYVMAVQT